MTKKSVVWFGSKLSPITAQFLYIISIIGTVCVAVYGITMVWAMVESYILWTSIEYVSGEYYTFNLINWIIPSAVMIILFLFFWYNITVCRRAFKR